MYGVHFRATIKRERERERERERQRKFCCPKHEKMKTKNQRSYHLPTHSMAAS
jgi:hypothetical protein